MADVKCVECGKERTQDQKGWVECEDCGAKYCPNCMGISPQETLESDHYTDMLKACPKCKGNLANLDWT